MAQPKRKQERMLPLAGGRRVKHSAMVEAYIAQVQNRYRKYRLPLDQGREVIDTAMGDRLLSDVVIQNRELRPAPDDRLLPRIIGVAQKVQDRARHDGYGRAVP